MVTVVGPGGVGKTRLALRTGASLTRSFRDGVWLAQLANLQDPALVTQAIADALGVPEDATGLSDRCQADAAPARGGTGADDC